MVGRVPRSALLLVALVLTACSGTTGPEEQPRRAPITVSVEGDTAYGGHDAIANVRLDYDPSVEDSILTLVGFSFLLSYDTRLFNFSGPSRGVAIEDWEYFASRTRPVPGCPAYPNQGTVQIIAARDLRNGTPPSLAPAHPQGIAAQLGFSASLDPVQRGLRGSLEFYSASCRHNFLATDSDNVVYVPDSTIGQIILDTYHDTIA